MASSERTGIPREIDRGIQLWRDRWSLLRLLYADRALLSALTGAQLLAALWPSAFALTVGWLAGRLGDVLGKEAPATAVVTPLVLVALCLLLEEATVALLGAAQIKAAGRVDGRARHRVRTFVLTCRGSTLLEDPEVADNVSRAGNITGDDHRSPGKAATGQLTLIFRILTAVVAAVLVARFSVILAVVLLFGSLLMRAVIRRQWMHLTEVKNGREHRARRARYWTDLAGGRAAAKEIRLFGLGDWAVARRSREALEWAGELWRVRYRVLKHQWPAVIIALVCSSSALFFPARAVVRGEMAAADLVTYLVAGATVITISRMGYEAFDIEYGLESVKALRELEERGTPSRQEAGSGRTGPGSGRPPAIHMENISFRYPGTDRPVLQNLDLRIEPGEVLAIVGKSGVGKTTLIKLLAGMYEPTSGRLTVDGSDLAAADVTAWRRRMGVVFQDFVKYPLSAADNVALGAPENAATPEALAAALEAGDARALVDSLPSGADTLLSAEWKDGVDLSGGQWQRVAIARALYAAQHGRDVLVMDEPTAHLDVSAEADFYRRIVAQASGQTVVLISHRMSTVRHADRILLMAEGRVAEEGTHEELMALDGDYARLFRLQATRFTIPEGGATPVLST
ncbi:ABC transporter ATP-binding protein [Streptomyces rubiginosohelvolus]|uniref:ABC transporter ATP-binding protein n=1 Tax=Streptomyces rubiginosohelvolus TaxID=67362 RepID=UPI0037A0E925